MRKIQTAAVNFCPELGKIENNVKNMERIVEEIKNNYPKTDLIVFPELAISGYECWDIAKDISEIPGEGFGTKHMCMTAKNNNVKIAVGYPEKSGKNIYNSAILINNNGDILGNYRKTHVLPHEKVAFKSGTDFTLFKTDIGNIGLLICWDAAFPETARLYSENGADYLVVLAAWEEPYRKEWELTIKSRAFDNGIPIIASNQTGCENEIKDFGRSLLVNSIGEITHNAGEVENAYIHGFINGTEVKKHRETFTSQIYELRKDIYSNESLKIFEKNKED